MNLLTARAGADLRRIHSRSFRRQAVIAVPSPTPLAGALGRLRARLADMRAAVALQRELQALSDTTLVDLGLTRSGIPAHVRRTLAARRASRRPQAPDRLSAHLLQDLAIQLRQGRTRVYTDVPLGVITRAPSAGRQGTAAAANADRLSRTA
jgi:uncharacterized protein YjiS (DUF1127 family)